MRHGFPAAGGLDVGAIAIDFPPNTRYMLELMKKHRAKGMRPDPPERPKGREKLPRKCLFATLRLLEPSCRRNLKSQVFLMREPAALTREKQILVFPAIAFFHTTMGHGFAKIIVPVEWIE